MISNGDASQLAYPLSTVVVHDRSRWRPAYDFHRHLPFPPRSHCSLHRRSTSPPKSHSRPEASLLQRRSTVSFDHHRLPSHQMGRTLIRMTGGNVDFQFLCLPNEPTWNVYRTSWPLSSSSTVCHDDTGDIFANRLQMDLEKEHKQIKGCRCRARRSCSRRGSLRTTAPRSVES